MTRTGTTTREAPLSGVVRGLEWGSVLEAWGAHVTDLSYWVSAPRRSSWYMWPGAPPQITLVA